MANRDWISKEFSKGIDAERAILSEVRTRADSPPDPALGVLYHQIAEADERHLAIIETIATRYGHTPSRGGGTGIGEALTRLKDKVTEIGASGHERIGIDLAAKGNAIHWEIAWVEAFESVGDIESARELAAILTEDKAHLEALQAGLNRALCLGAGASPEVADTAAK